jgi:hypothetical protein
VHHTTDITASLIAFGLQLLVLIAFLFQVEEPHVSLTDIPKNIRWKIGALGVAAKAAV